MAHISRRRSDHALLDVRTFLRSKPGLALIVGRVLRQAFDEVIDGRRTGRYKVEELEKTEKTYIGTKVEIILRDELGLERGSKLDNCIAGYEVDTKFSLAEKWMIPPESFQKMCLLVTGDDNRARCKLGLARMHRSVLRDGGNRDRKKQLSAAGRKQIFWLVRAPMPPNFMLRLRAVTRDAIHAAPSGRARVQELFRRVTRRCIPRSVVEQVARQRDPLKRAREAKVILAREGFLVLCATYKTDRVQFQRYGITPEHRDDWLSVRVR